MSERHSMLQQDQQSGPSSIKLITGTSVEADDPSQLSIICLLVV